MKTLNDIVNISNEYLNAHNESNHRAKIWREEKFDFIYKILDSIKNEIIAKNEYFKSNLYLDKDEKKTHLRLRSGKNYIPLSENDSESFEINFLLISNSKIYVFARSNKDSQQFEDIELDLISNIEEIDQQKILDLVFKSIEVSKKRSYLFVGDE
ncbi:MAG: hypothetical protein ACOH1N_14940 [Lutibacter sp.]